MLAAVMSGFLLSIAAPMLHRVVRRSVGWLSALLALGLFLYFCRYISPIAEGRTVLAAYSWASSLGVDLTFRLDGLSLMFALLVTGIGALVMLYASSYLAGHPHLGRFYAYMLAFMASMLGVALSDNLIALFVFWELTSLTSYFLIGFNHESETARKAAWQALLVTGLGGLALLMGLILLGHAGGSFEFSVLFGKADLIRAHPLYLPVFLLVLAGALTKSAQFPFHFWLPNAMEAPTPVSAYLHSATMVKAGVYLLARLSPLMGGTALWSGAIITAGAVTMLLGGVLALKEVDLKRILAYSTVSILGALTFLLGLGASAAVVAAMAYLVVHALYKAALFLVAGIVEHGTGTRDVRRLGALSRAMPLTTVACALAALSMAGLPPLFGFIGKELLYTAALEGPLASVLTAVAMLTSMLLVAVAGIVGFHPFFGAQETTGKKPHEASPALWIGPLLLAVLGLVVGLEPQIATTVVSPAASSVLSRIVSAELQLFHGLTLQLVLSGVTVGVGAAAYLGRETLRNAISRVDYGAALGPSQGYNLTLAVTNAIARAQTRLLQSGHLHIYLLIIIATTVGLVGISLAGQRNLLGPHGWADIRFHELLVSLVVLAATVTVVRARSRFFAVVALGAVGYGMGLIYLTFGAPDLAITQVSVDTLTVVLLVLVLYPMPRFARYSGNLARARDGAGALAVGILVTLLTLMATGASRGSRLAPYFAENSYVQAKGRNIVNVILVDFRALDTMGEITVLAVAAVGVYSLLKLRMDKS